MKCDIKSKKGQSAMEMLILIAIMLIIMMVGVIAFKNFSDVQGKLVGCTRYVDLVDSITDDSKKPVEFKRAYVSLASNNTDMKKETMDVCSLSVDKPGSVKSTILVSLAQAKEDSSSRILNPIKPITTQTEPGKTDSEGGFSGWWIALILVLIFASVGFAESAKSSSLDSKKREEDEKKFKALQETVLKEKEKEKETIKTSKKIYI